MLRFGGSVNHDPHILYTLSALQILVLCDKLDIVNHDKIASFISSLHLEDGSFKGDKWGEIDTRFSYCALSAMSILGRLNSGEINVKKATEFVGRCVCALFQILFHNNYVKYLHKFIHILNIVTAVRILMVVSELFPVLKVMLVKYFVV